MNKKIAILTIGQSPRTDLQETIQDFISPPVTCIEMGALDALSLDEIHQLAPVNEHDPRLVTRLQSGDQVIVSAKLIQERMVHLVETCDKKEVDIIIIACTGHFPKFNTKIPIIYPDQVTLHWMHSIFSNQHLCIVVPHNEQKEMIKQKWIDSFNNLSIIACSPYEWNDNNAREIATFAEQQQCDVIVMDCIGYAEQMKRMIQAETNLPVILPRTLALSASQHI
ncbi:AroM family protein [Sporosarcina ureilytica]|uniref:AroM protein n=1 Tax=Sporosarcina ureilytica TaxID=298596 RepID=A0A1D8JJ40_9BACL|nr:AroM family protein [Sporosarcina ureilytica]AOV08727.1 hypothetical protein BI350_15050 [Sporosarcina ureilytica]